MNVLESFHFLRPLWLLLLPGAVGLWWRLRKSSDPLRGWRAVMAPELLDAMMIGTEDRRGYRENMLLAGWILGCIALAGPTWRPEPSPFADDPHPVMIVLKAGESMEQSDLSPTRMERAQLKITDFADARKGQPLGLIAYADTSHLVLPPTRDSQIVADLAAEITPSIMPRPGDNLPLALTMAAETLRDTAGAILVVTDTVPTGNSQTLETFLREYSNPVFFLAIAREQTPELQDISLAATALNAPVEIMTADSADIESLIRKCARTPVSITSAGEGVRWEEAGWWLVPILALLSLAGFRREHEQSTDTAETAA